VGTDWECVEKVEDYDSRGGGRCGTRVAGRFRGDCAPLTYAHSGMSSRRKKQAAKKKKAPATAPFTPATPVARATNPAVAASTQAANAALGSVEEESVQRAYNRLRKQLTSSQKTHPDPIDALRLKYTLLGKEEWWFIMDECLEEIGKTLLEKDYVMVDWFMTASRVLALNKDVRKVYESGKLRLGVLAGGKSGSSLTYTHEKVRGDMVEWFDGTEDFWNHQEGSLKDHLHKLDTFISELSNHLPGLEGILNRSKAMVTCYPGNGARYIKHTDNHCKFGDGDNCNGRRLTSLSYLNNGWRKGDGGELRVYGTDGETVRAEIEPVPGRVVLFWSDFRVPHEVLPAHEERFAVAVWYFDKVERARALAAGVTDTEDGSRTGTGAVDQEYERIQQEVASMEAKYGKGAKTNVPIGAPIEPTVEQTPKPTAAKAAAAAAVEQTPGETVRVAIEEEVEDKDEEEGEEVERGNMVEGAGQGYNAGPPSSASSAYTTLKEEEDVWELDE
jgi:hypothetical protein